ncbi:MAG: RNA polymerase sigma factor [Bdellovibrio sp.]|nr:RNA polymerase sigma factor [Bdellovibrio sp.]
MSILRKIFHDSDEDLIEKVKGQSSKAYFELFTRYQKAVYNFALSYSHRPEVAAEITQECFLKLMTKAATFEEGKIFRPWFWCIVRNQCHDWYRKEKDERLELESSSTNLVENEGTTDEMFMQLLQKIEQRQIWETLELLRTSEREILLLWLEDLSYLEMAEVMSKSQDGVKGLLKRAKQKFAQLWREKNEE